MRRALWLVLLAGCQAVVGIDDIVEEPCVANAPIDFATVALPATLFAAVDEVAAVDLTHDGKPDLVVVRLDGADQPATSILVDRAGAGDKLASFGPEATLIAGRARFADLDADGSADVASSCVSAGCFEVRLNRTEPGAAVVKLVYPTTFNVSGFAIADLAIGDVIGDARPDVVTLDSSGVVTVWENSTPPYDLPRFTPRSSLGETAELASGRLAVIDLNGDGKLDLVIATTPGTPFGATGPTKVTLALHAAGDGFAPPIEIAQAGEPVTRLDAADLDGDGKLDLVIGTADQHALWLARLGAPGGYAAATTSCAGSLGAVADQDGDGALDLIVLQADNWLCEQVNQPGTGFAPHRIARLPYVALYGLPDINHDGRPDLVGAGFPELDLLVSGSHCEPPK